MTVLFGVDLNFERLCLTSRFEHRVHQGFVRGFPLAEHKVKGREETFAFRKRDINQLFELFDHRRHVSPKQ